MLLKQSMDFLAELNLEDLIGADHAQSQRRPVETCSEADEEDAKMANDVIYPNWSSSNHAAIAVPYLANVGRATHASQYISDSPSLKRSYSRISDPERARRKKDIDRAYRFKCKRAKEEMQENLETLTGENESLKKENESLKSDNADMNQTLKDQAKEIERLKNDLSQLKREWEKQNVLVQTLSGLIADPVRLENERLKNENASLRKNASFNDIPQLLEECAKLKLENKVLRVQNDALCGKIISDNDRKYEQEEEARISTGNGVHVLFN